MKPRSGKSADYSEERRQEIFETYMLKKDYLFDREIGAMFGLDAPNFYSMRQSKWWKQMEEDSHNE